MKAVKPRKARGKPWLIHARINPARAAAAVVRDVLGPDGYCRHVSMFREEEHDDRPPTVYHYNYYEVGRWHSIAEYSVMGIGKKPLEALVAAGVVPKGSRWLPKPTRSQRIAVAFACGDKEEGVLKPLGTANGYEGSDGIVKITPATINALIRNGYARRLASGNIKVTRKPHGVKEY